MLAVTLTGVATELPLAGLEMVIIPFEVEADAKQPRRKTMTTRGFIEAPGQHLIFRRKF